MKRNVLLTALFLAACGDGEKIEVSVNYAASADAKQVAALHAWVVTGADGAEASCNLLVAGALEPYDVQLQTLGEGGARSDEPLFAAARKREGVVYVVAYDYAGQPLYAGCATVSGGSTTVALGPLQVYLCSNPTTPDGARCDDGNLCTLGERCRSGQCTNGTPRDCTKFNGLCTAGTCDPNVGCVKVNANEGQPCDDGLFCTGPGTCTSGTCAAPPIACPTSANQCLQSVCDEQLDRCIFLPKPTGASCDDGNPCRTNDSCNANGVCVGTTPVSATIECDRNACTANDQCSSGACIPGTASGAVSCDDGNPCTTNDTCSGTTCAGVAATVPTSCDDGNPCTTNDTCSVTTCVGGGYASSTTPCWDTSYCYVGDRCTGFSGTCSSGSVYDPDYDGDGCTRPSCSSSICSDCDDADPFTNSNAPERCGDNKDNDCDGFVDEAGCVPS